MDRARVSDREAFAAVLQRDGLEFGTSPGGEVRVNDPGHGAPPSVYVRRQENEPSENASTVLATISPGPSDRLELSLTEVEYSGSTPTAPPSTRMAAVFKSSAGDFFVETHVGRLVAAGEFTRYFWTLAGAHLGLDD